MKIATFGVLKFVNEANLLNKAIYREGGHIARAPSLSIEPFVLAIQYANAKKMVNWQRKQSVEVLIRTVAETRALFSCVVTLGRRRSQDS